MNVKDLKDCLDHAARQMDSTKTLDLSHNDLNSNGCVQEILKWIAHFKPTNVILNDCNFGDAAVSAFAKFFRDDTILQRISFRDNFIRAAGTREWIETLRNNTHIQSIDFLGNDLGDATKDLVEWFLASRTCRSLCGLTPHIHGFSIDDLTKSDALLIAANLEKNTDLKSIEIFGFEPLIAVDVILNALTLNRTLVRLKITKFPASLMALTALTKGLSKNLSLRSLELSLDDSMPELKEGRIVNALFDAIECGRSLTAIRLEHLPPGSVVDNLCARLIQNHKALAHFSIFQYRPDQSAVDLLCRGISQNSNLRVLRLGGELAGQLTAEAFREIGDAAMSRSTPTPFTVRIEGEGDKYFEHPEQPANTRFPEWEIDDFVELKVTRSAWVSAQIIALFSDGEYSLIRSSGEVQSNVHVEDIRKGSEFKHAQESTETIVTPGGRDKHAAKRAHATDSHRKAGISSPSAGGASPRNTGEAAFVAGESVEIRFYGDNSWYSARVHSVPGPGLVDVVMTDDNSLEQQVEAHMVRRPAAQANGVASAYDAGMFARGDYVFARVPKNDGAWVRARVVSDKKNGTYDVRLEDQSDEKGLRGRHLKHYFKVNDEVDARRNKSMIWERAVVKKTDREGKYLLYFQTDDENEIDVPGRRIMIKGREEIRTQAILAYHSEKGSSANGSGASALSPNSRPSRKGSSRFALNEKVEIPGASGKWIEGRIVGLNPDSTYSVRLLDGSTLEHVDDSIMRKLGGGAGVNGGTPKIVADAENGGIVPSRPPGPAPSSSFKEQKNRKMRTDSVESVDDGPKDKDRKERKEKKRRQSSSSSEGKKKSPRSANVDSGEDSGLESSNNETAAMGTLAKNKSIRVDLSDNESPSPTEVTKNTGPGPTSASAMGPSSHAKTVVPHFIKAERVAACYKGQGTYYDGIIARVHDNGEYDVLYDDNTLEIALPARFIRKSAQPMPSFPNRGNPMAEISNAEQPTASNSINSLGAIYITSPSADNIGHNSARNTVLVFDQRSHSWRPGSMTSKNANGSFRVRLQATNEELDVSLDQINFNSISSQVATEPISLSGQMHVDDVRRPASANLLQAGREREREKEARDLLHSYSPTHNHRPHTSGGYPTVVDHDQSRAIFSQTADSGVSGRKREVEYASPSSPIASLGPAVVPGFVSMDGESLFHSSSKWNVNVRDKSLSSVQNRPLPSAGTGFGVLYNTHVRDDTWSPMLAYVFDIQAQALVDVKSASLTGTVPPMTPSNQQLLVPPLSPGGASLHGQISSQLVPSLFLPPDCVVTIVPTSSNDCIEFGHRLHRSDCQMLWDGEKNSCPIFMRLKSLPTAGTVIVVKVFFYVHGIIVACASVEVSGVMASKKRQSSKPAFSTLRPEMRFMSDTRVGMFKSVYVVTPENDSSAPVTRHMDIILENAVKELPFLTVRRPEANELINSSYIRNADHIMLCVADMESVGSGDANIQAVLELIPTPTERAHKISATVFRYVIDREKELPGILKELSDANICTYSDGILKSWVYSERGLRRHLRNKLLLSSTAIAKALLEHCREDRQVPIAMLVYPANESGEFDTVSLYSTLNYFKSQEGGEYDSGTASVKKWKLQFLCEDFVCPVDEPAHAPIDFAFSPSLFLECYPLLKLTIAVLLLVKVGLANSISLPTTVNVLNIVNKYSIHSLISLSIFYDEIEIYCRDCSDGGASGFVTLGGANGSKLIASSAQDSRLANEEVEYEELELLALAAQVCESSIASVALGGGLARLSRSLRQALDERIPMWTQLSSLRLFSVDESSRWVCLSAYQRSWRNLLLVLNPALASEDGLGDGLADDSVVDESATSIVRDPLEEIASHIKLGLRIRDDSIATTTARCLVKEGCESWEDVLNLVEFVGGLSDDGGAFGGAVSHQSFQAVNKFLLSAGVPVIAAGKLVAFLRQHHSSKSIVGNGAK
jgi:hypothetical protein